MTIIRRPPDQLDPRAAWAVPLGLGLGGILIAAIVIGVGIGYDVAGRSPPPLVLLGLSLLIGPQFWLARKNYLDQQQQTQVEQLLRTLTEQRTGVLPHRPERVALTEGDDGHRG